MISVAISQSVGRIQTADGVLAGIVSGNALGKLTDFRLVSSKPNSGREEGHQTRLAVRQQRAVYLLVLEGARWRFWIA